MNHFDRLSSVIEGSPRTMGFLDHQFPGLSWALESAVEEHRRLCSLGPLRRLAIAWRYLLRGELH